MNNVTLLPGDCLDHLRALPANSVDSVVTDPPYELGFMGRAWDASGIAYQVTLWREVYRVLKPGGHLVAFGGTRTYHRMACAMEDAGLEIRDSLHWLYGSGFPKSHDVSKALDKAAGAERAVVGKYIHPATGKVHADFRTDNDRAAYGDFSMCEDTRNITAPATDLAAQWAGWGTALKPAHEPIVLARKPLAGTVAATVAAWGTGGINVDACRVNPGEAVPGGGPSYGKCAGVHEGWRRPAHEAYESKPGHDAGRWPPNVLLTHSAACNGHCAPDCPVAALDRQSGQSSSSVHMRGLEGRHDPGQGAAHNRIKPYSNSARGHNDTGGASRFFPVLPWDPATDVPFAYVPKASRRERNAGCAGLPEQLKPRLEGDTRPCHMADGKAFDGRDKTAVANHHPCVKPVALLSWLVTLVTPPGGVVLDPFMGSGSTGVACVRLGFDFVGCEQEPEYLIIAEARINHALAERQRAPEASQAHLPILATLDNRTPACTHLATGLEPCACVDGHQEQESA